MSRRTQDALAEMSAMATETLGASKTIKSFGQETHQSAAYSERAENSYTAEVARLSGRAAMIGGVMFVTVLCFNLMGDKFRQIFNVKDAAL